MVDRYYNGIEKFAGRYQRFGQWETATRLYLEVQQDQPNRASVRRNLYRCYVQLGQPEDAQWHLEKAIEIDLLRLVNKPESLAAHISLVRNYQLIDDRQKMQQYLQQAMAIGLAGKVADPKNPGIAYWLGRSYELQGDYAAAYQEFERAVNLRPDTLKYRKAMLAAGRQLPENLPADKS
jgi:tetratricopeptide (TPR) repeat protein